MFRKLCCFALASALVAFTGPAAAQQGDDQPHLRAALHELREARSWLGEAQNSWPPGYLEQALHSTEDAIQSVRAMLNVKDVDTDRGVNRAADSYQRYQDYPQLRAALQDLREARQELLTAKADDRALKDRALGDIEVAIGNIEALMRKAKP